MASPGVGRDHAINVGALASSLERDFSSQRLCLSTEPSIFTVPNILLRHNERSYTPTAFSIGPYHHTKSCLKKTENIKLQYLHDFIERVGVSLTDLIGAIAELESNARKHYSQQIDFTPDEFVKILVLDGGFLIELFRKNVSPEDKKSDQFIFSMSCMLQHLLHDLILLENQIPWIVLQRLFIMTDLGSEGRFLEDVVLRFLRDLLPTSINSQFSVECRHILELLRNILVSTSPQRANSRDGWPPIPSATELARAGVKFKARHSKGLAISFDNGVLEVSQILIQETTETLFRDLISFEQCSQHCRPIFTSYAIILDNLIDTPDDIDVLSENGIVDNWLNRDDATKFFNNLYHDTFVKEFYYPQVCREVKSYCKQPWPKWRTLLILNYCSNPWVIASTMAASVLLVLTFLQTIYTMKGPS